MLNEGFELRDDAPIRCGLTLKAMNSETLDVM
jgi:hypothetical protein